MSEVSPRGYRWGKFQGASAAGFGLLMLLAAPWMKHDPLLYLAGVLYIATGLGILAKRRYGFVLLYLVALLIVGSSLVAPSSREHYLLTALFLAWWVVPALIYFPKRWKEFR